MKTMNLLFKKISVSMHFSLDGIPQRTCVRSACGDSGPVPGRRGRDLKNGVLNSAMGFELVDITAQQDGELIDPLAGRPSSGATKQNSGRSETRRGALRRGIGMGHC
jgi:hypothetical protein